LQKVQIRERRTTRTSRRTIVAKGLNQGENNNTVEEVVIAKGSNQGKLNNKDIMRATN
jgi:hypothetical protein